MDKPQAIYEKLMSIQSIEKMDTKQVLFNIALLTNAASSLGKLEGTNKTIEWGEQLLIRKNLNAQEKIQTHYFLSISFGDLALSRSHKNSWFWEYPERENEVFHLRSAIQNSKFKEIPDKQKAPIFTNLANALSTIGRPIEAIRYWQKAINIDQDFVMAIGNKGTGMIAYQSALYDQGHKIVFLQEAQNLIAKALETKNSYFEQGAKEHFEEKLSLIPKEILKNKINFDKFSLGNSDEEKIYREWVLEEGLFLNPLNDIIQRNIAARDILSLPDMIRPLGEPPIYHKLFSQIKQEFVSARYLFYESLTSKEPHFSDKETFIVDNLDYPSSSLSMEKAKMAYSHIYSIFDKIALFLNEYLTLGIPHKSVSFRRVWAIKNGKELIFNPVFQNWKNWILRGLFWISKDFYENKFKDIMEPDAERMVDVRNHIEHKGFSVHEFGLSEEEIRKMTTPINLSIMRDDFEHKILRLFRLAREAIIYLSLAVNIEELKKSTRIPKGKVAPAMQTFIWNDKFKL